MLRDKDNGSKMYNIPHDKMSFLPQVLVSFESASTGGCPCVAALHESLVHHHQLVDPMVCNNFSVDSQGWGCECPRFGLKAMYPMKPVACTRLWSILAIEELIPDEEKLMPSWLFKRTPAP